MKSVTITEARRVLFDLFEEVLSKGDAVIAIEHRNRKERAVLASESYVRSLEARVAALEARTGSGFRLIGSVTAVGDPDTILDEVRARQAELFEAKLRKF